MAASQQRAFVFVVLLAVSLLAIASVALSVYIANQPQQSVTTYLRIVEIVPAAGPSCVSIFTGAGGLTGTLSFCGTTVINTATFPPSESPAVDFAKLLVIIFVGTAIALVVEYVVVEHTKPPTKKRQTGQKQITAPAVTKPKRTKETGVKFCANCGNSLPSGANFCNECGSKQV